MPPTVTSQLSFRSDDGVLVLGHSPFMSPFLSPDTFLVGLHDCFVTFSGTGSPGDPRSPCL